jgi:hypothetical protein
MVSNSRGEWVKVWAQPSDVRVPAGSAAEFVGVDARGASIEPGIDRANSSGALVAATWLASRLDDIIMRDALRSPFHGHDAQGRLRRVAQADPQSEQRPPICGGHPLLQN